MMLTPKKSIPYLAVGLSLSGCEGDQSRQEQLDETVQAFCLQFDACYGDDYNLPPGACVAYYSTYLDAVALVRGDGAEECLAAWETALGCIGSSSCDQNDECLEADENGKDLIDRACE
jgi:hypothetical protein